MAGLKEELLFEAVAADDVAEIKALAARAVDLNAHDVHAAGATALTAAAKANRLACTAALLELGADPDEPDPSGRTPLHVACRYGHLEVVKLLLADKRCDVAATAMEFNYAPLHFAADAGHAAVIHALAAAGADVNIGNAFGETPLHLAARHNHADAVRALLAVAADPAVATAERGATPLHYAAQAGSQAAAAVLHDGGSSSHWQDPQGATAADVARQFGHHAIATSAVGSEDRAWEAAEAARLANEAARSAAKAVAERVAVEAARIAERERQRAKRRAFLELCDAERAAVAEAERAQVEKSRAEARERVARVQREETVRKAEAAARRKREEDAEANRAEVERQKEMERRKGRR